MTVLRLSLVMEGLLLLRVAMWSILFTTAVLSAAAASASSSHSPPPEASSTLLRMHRLYLQQPPHDMHLYNVLQVSPNATAAQIQKSYRRLSLRHHPDKHSGNNNNNKHAALRLEGIREAYEILKDDRTRLPYHRYGIVNPTQAVLVLTGSVGGGVSAAALHDNNPDWQALLRLVGFGASLAGYKNHNIIMDEYPNYCPPSLSEASEPPMAKSPRRRQEEVERIAQIANDLMETIRPAVEGRITYQALSHVMATECDRLKRLPMGAHILRCVGRAYRWSGRRYLRRRHAAASSSFTASLGQAAAATRRMDPNDGPSFASNNNKMISPGRFLWLSDPLSETVRDKWRTAKHVMTAAVASGRVVLAEQAAKQQATAAAPPKKQSKTRIAYDGWYNGQLGSLLLNDNDEEEEKDDDAPPTDEELRNEQRLKAQTTLLESLQTEALWKISKIDIDRVVCKACDLILQDDSLFLSSSSDSATANNDGSSHHDASFRDAEAQGSKSPRQDGWVGSTGIALPTDQGRYRAALALVLMGDVMVQRSKEGTAWME